MRLEILRQDVIKLGDKRCYLPFARSLVQRGEFLLENLMLGMLRDIQDGLQVTSNCSEAAFEADPPHGIQEAVF